jgi:exopolysaccharide production protein ExoQ
MPPIIASFIYLGFVFWLFRRDFREKPNVTRALWLPYFWVFISATRFVSEWLGLFGLNWGGASVEEGSPVDAVSIFGLIGAGIVVLMRRRVSAAEYIRRNPVAALYLLYCLIACAWSDYPLVGLKRWVKLLGQPIMVLIILTEPDPIEAITRLFKRLAYFCLPVSILFIKYYPDWGRGFSFWTGQADNHGVATGKNGLGFICMILGVFYFWHLLRVWKWEKGKRRKHELWFCLLFGWMIYWLFEMAPSCWPLLWSVLSSLICIGLIFICSPAEDFTFY